MTMRSTRPFYGAIALVAAALLGFGYYLQFAKGLEPCPLCIFQRVTYIALGLVALGACVHGPRGFGARLYDGLILIAAVTGSAIAGRQVWMQHLPPDQVPSCGPGLDYMLEVFPLTDVIRMAFTGSGECAEVSWTFLSLSIAEWSLICFVLIGLLCIVHMFRRGPA